MPEARRRMTSEEFQHRLDELRSKIDSVPRQHRATLRAAADKAREQHERMQRACAWIDDMVADLGLMVEHSKFHVAVCRCELRELDPQGRFPLRRAGRRPTVRHWHRRNPTSTTTHNIGGMSCRQPHKKRRRKAKPCR